uniref:Uncharacterized protein n=1 Tax=Pipistrellus kuhlii TaxID=59472 RepID=A0A7J8B306_PIPKU|nr:hypothetical protein mPipKuh1_007916 [Pipistrellus kuhlii]
MHPVSALSQALLLSVVAREAEHEVKHRSCSLGACSRAWQSDELRVSPARGQCIMAGSLPVSLGRSFPRPHPFQSPAAFFHRSTFFHSMPLYNSVYFVTSGAPLPIFPQTSLPRLFQSRCPLRAGRGRGVVSDSSFWDTVSVLLVISCSENKQEDSFLPGRIRGGFKREEIALAGLAQWIEHRLLDPGFIPVNGTCPGCRLDPQQGARRCQPLNDSLSSLMFLFLSPFLSEIIKIENF